MPDLFSASLLFRQFLVLPACPPGWERFDLYLLRDGETAFYAGQSQRAHARVWEHIHGHSIPGRFLLVNWPRSASFQVELFSSGSPRFACVGHRLDAAEQMLIEEWAPCFNVALNERPLPLPLGYLPPNAPLRGLVSYKRMLREAEVAARRDANRAGWDETGG